MKVQPCGTSKWDDRGLDLPYSIEAIDFRVTGRGHERIDTIYRFYCDRSAHRFDGSAQMPEGRIATWLCRHCRGFVFVTTPTVRCTIISFMDGDDAERFEAEFVRKPLPPMRQPRDRSQPMTYTSAAL